MPFAAGRLDQRAQFLRRPVILDEDGEDRGQRGDAFDPWFTVWAGYVRLRGAEKLEGGRLSDEEAATLLIRDSSQARQVTAADRVRVQGREYAIKSVALPERRTGLIPMEIASSLGD